MRNIMKLFVFLIASVLMLNVAYAEQKQPLTIIVPYPPGGDTDIMARLFATKYTEKTGRTTVIENKPGAAGVIGFMHISKSPNDGTVIGVVPSTLTTAPYFNPTAAKYDPKTDFTPILQLTGHGMYIAVNADSGVKTVADLIEANKAGKVKAYGTPGVASPQNIFGELFKQTTKTDMLHVPFKGNAEVTNALMNNTIQVTFNTSLPLLALVDAGKVNIIANAGTKRSTMHPNVPTLAEQGVKGVDFESWIGFVGPKDMDPKIASEYNLVLNEILRQPEVQDRMKKSAMHPVGSTPANFRDRIAKDSDRFQRLSKQLDIKVE